MHVSTRYQNVNNGYNVMAQDESSSSWLITANTVEVRMSSSAKDEARNVANGKSELVGMSTFYNEWEF